MDRAYTLTGLNTPEVLNEVLEDLSEVVAYALKQRLLVNLESGYISDNPLLLSGLSIFLAKELNGMLNDFAYGTEDIEESILYLQITLNVERDHRNLEVVSLPILANTDNGPRLLMLDLPTLGLTSSESAKITLTVRKPHDLARDQSYVFFLSQSRPVLVDAVFVLADIDTNIDIKIAVFEKDPDHILSTLVYRTICLRSGEIETSCLIKSGDELHQFKAFVGVREEGASVFPARFGVEEKVDKDGLLFKAYALEVATGLLLMGM